jgi:tRNA nucleotidyltransferase (CCA-adding enzyme)
MSSPPRRETEVEAARVESAVAARIAPSPELLARVERVRSELPERVQEAARSRSSPLVRSVVAGSAARGTFLHDRLDIDLFLLFPPDLPRDRLREEGLALGRAVLADPQTRYAEHPYLRGRYGEFTVDAVPGFAISDPSHPISPVDRTPFHQAYLAERETAFEVGEIRLTKQFLRGLGIYGSEARTEGFSGYLVELLVLKYGSFRALLSAARRWRIPARLEDPGREAPRLPDDVALVLTDPVDPHRNVATALSRKNLGLFVVGAGAYLDAPSEAWFDAQPPARISRAEAIRRTVDRQSHVCVVELPRPEIVDDTLYPQVRKAESAIADEAARGGFEVLGSSSAADAERIVIALEVAHRLRSPVRRRDGPPPGIDRVGQFLGKWTGNDASVLQGPYVRDDGSLGVETRRTECEVETVLGESLARLSLGKDLTPDGPDQAAVRPLAAASDSDALAEALRRLLDKRLPWVGRR